MKNWYFDLTLLKQCTGILAGPGTEVILCGTRIHTEDERYRDSEPALRLERERDLHFWFGKTPRIDIYTVPQMELGGYDSRGGFLAGSPDFSLGAGERIYYIDAQRQCWQLPEGLIPGWRERLIPAPEIRIFGSFEEARKSCPILRPENEEQLLEIFRKMEEA